MRAGCCGPSGFFPLLRPTGTETMNLLPSPRRLSSEMLPPSSFTRRSTIESPRPNPSTPCAERRRTNSWKMRSFSSRPMPRPVSRTENTSRPSTTSARIVTLPSSVNFSALDIRLSATWRIRKGSPITSSPAPGPASSTRAMPFAWAMAANPSRIVSNSCAGQNATLSTSTLLISSR